MRQYLQEEDDKEVPLPEPDIPIVDEDKEFNPSSDDEEDEEEELEDEEEI